MSFGPDIAFTLAKILYKQVLRSLIVQAVEDSESKWDDLALSISDKIFGWEE